MFANLRVWSQPNAHIFQMPMMCVCMCVRESDRERENMRLYEGEREL